MCSVLDHGKLDLKICSVFELHYECTLFPVQQIHLCRQKTQKSNHILTRYYFYLSGINCLLQKVGLCIYFSHF